MKRRRNVAAEYDGRRHQINELLGDIRIGLDRHPPEDRRLTWGHVGDLEHYGELLQEVSDQILRRGEYAEGDGHEQ